MIHRTSTSTAQRSTAASTGHRRRLRAGAAMVELSLLLPMLLFLLLAGMDYGRVFKAAVIVSNCARNGALYASDPNISDRSQFATLDDAVRADAADIDASLLTYTTLEGTDASGYGWTEVTVTYPFQTVINYPGIPSSVVISRTVRFRKVPTGTSP